jgi:hypothetical protein
MPTDGSGLKPSQKIMTAMNNLSCCKTSLPRMFRVFVIDASRCHNCTKYALGSEWLTHGALLAPYSVLGR